MIEHHVTDMDSIYTQLLFPNDDMISLNIAE